MKVKKRVYPKKVVQVKKQGTSSIQSEALEKASLVKDGKKQYLISLLDEMIEEIPMDSSKENLPIPIELGPPVTITEMIQINKIEKILRKEKPAENRVIKLDISPYRPPQEEFLESLNLLLRIIENQHNLGEVPSQGQNPPMKRFGY